MVDSGHGSFEQAMKLYQEEKWEESLKVFDSLVHQSPDNETYHYFRANLYWWLRRIPEAKKAFELALKLYPKDTDAIINYSSLLLDEYGENEKAVDWLKYGISLDPQNPKLLANLGLAYMKLEQYDDAIETVNKVISLNDQLTVAHGILASSYAAKGMFQQAIEEFKIALSIDPDDPEIHNNIGLFYQERNQIDLALCHFKAAIRSDPSFMGAHSNLGNLFYRTGEIDLAIEEKRAVTKLDPDYAPAHYDLAGLLSKKAQYDEAIKEYRAAIQINPDFAEAYCNLGQTYRELGEFEKSITLLRRALAIDVDPQSEHIIAHINAHIGLAAIHLDTGYPEEAIQELQVVLELDPNHLFAKRKLRELLQNMENLDTSQEDLDSRITAFEKSMRLLIAQTLSKAGLDTWGVIKSLYLNDEVEKRIKDYLIKNPALDKEDINPLEFLFLFNYLKILKNQWNVFEPIFRSKSETEQYLKNINELRNSLKHAREPTQPIRLSGEASIVWFEEIFAKYGLLSV